MSSLSTMRRRATRRSHQIERTQSGARILAVHTAFRRTCTTAMKDRRWHACCISGSGPRLWLFCPMDDEAQLHTVNSARAAQGVSFFGNKQRGHLCEM
jgi:Tfp pilus assembly protein FimT